MAPCLPETAKKVDDQKKYGKYLREWVGQTRPQGQLMMLAGTQNVEIEGNIAKLDGEPCRKSSDYTARA